MFTWLTVAAARLHGFLRGRPLDQDFERELAAHLELLTDENVRRGMSPDAALRAARLRLGGTMQLREQQNEQRGLPLLDTTLQDVRYALRSMRKYPGYAAVAIATLAVGIAAGTTVFAFAGAVLLRPLPYKDPDALVRIFETNPLKNWTRNIAAPANWADWRQRSTSFTDIAGYEQFNLIGSGASDVFLTGFGEPQGLKGLGVSGNLFAVLGAAPLMGRVFTDDETYEGKASVVILSYGLWQSAFGGDPGIVGRTITLSGRNYDVVGVMPRAFFFPGRDVQLWTPFAYTRELIARSRWPHWLGVVGRLRPGVSLAQAQQDMNGVAAQLERQYPDTNVQMGVRLEALHGSFASEPRTALLMLVGAVGLLFLIVCANIANLQLGRAVSRSRELSIRRALGAGRGRLIRQLLTESMLLSLSGGALGFALAAAAQSALTRYAASFVPLFAEIRIDRPVMTFAIALSLLAPLVFGALPALASAGASQVTERTESSSKETYRLRNLLIASEVALSIVLVVGAVLLARSLLRLQAVDPGFVQQHATAFTVTLPTVRYPNSAARMRAFGEMERRLAEQPALASVGATSTLALRGYTWTGDATVEGRAPQDFERELRHSSVSAAYFRTLGIKLLRGRQFEATDTIDKPQVAIVNQALEARYFRGADAVGKRITFGRPVDNSPWITIVGVVANIKQDGMDREPQPEAYSPITQRMSNPMTFVIRSAATAEAVVNAARLSIQSFDKDLALTDVTTLDDVVEESMEGHRFRTALLSGFAVVALLLAALGIYGVLAYFVSQRSRELGIRLALGAQPAALFALVVRQGLRPVAAGTIVGLAGAGALTGLMRSLLFGVSALDPATFALALAALAVLTITACALPARRATRVDPLVALRNAD